MTPDVDRRSELAKTVGRNPSPEPAAGPAALNPDHCITCSDEGVPMLVVRIDESRGLALCEDSEGRRSSVEIALIDGVRAEDTLLVHAGTALVRVEAVGA